MDRETVITHLQIIHTWASFARERDLQFFTAKHLEDIAQWAYDAINLLKEDCHNCKLECLLQKYDELKEKYDELLKEQEPLEPYACEGDMKCGNGCEIVGYIRESDGKIERLSNYCPYCGRPVKWD